jgi:hypothetical protein
MKYLLFPIAILFFYINNGCVQKSYKKTVVVTLTVPNTKGIKMVGIRGNGKPLSWSDDFEMKEVIKDSVYTATATTITGYKFAEIKFTINGEFELKQQPNRRLVFSSGDTTYYNAVFDSNK